MTWVKVCGLRAEADVEAAVEAGADAIGLVVIEASPRHVSVERAASLADGLGVEVVVLSDAPDVEEMVEVIHRVGAGAIQPYGPAAADIGSRALEAGWRVLRPVRAGEESIDDVPLSEIPLLDASRGALLGGTGRRVAAADIPSSGRRFVLAGGLDPHNVADAIQSVRPWGVDASSGLESSRGTKDPALIRAFIEEAKQA